MSEAFATARGLGKSFGSKRVLENVSFDVEAGDIVGVLGKNGAGKTTLLELMLGFTPPTAGSVRLFGHDSFSLPAAAKTRIGFVPQQDELVNQLTGRAQLELIASFYPQWDRALIERLCGGWELDPGERIRVMSVGQRQKLAILLALGHRPDLLVLDEPVASLDPIARRRFLEQLIEIAADRQRAVVLSSHIVGDIERLANKIWIVKDRRLYWRGEFDELKDSVVRIHVRSRTPLAGDWSVPNALSLHREERYATAVVAAWSTERHAAMEQQAGAELEVEPLTLEDIFLELHR